MRRKPLYNSIRWRIATPYVLLILASLLGLERYVSFQVRQDYFETLQKQLSADAHLLADWLAQSLPRDQDALKRLDLDETVQRWDELLGARVTVIALDGLVIGESSLNHDRLDNHANRPEVLAALQGQDGSSLRYSASVNDELLYQATLIETGGIPIGIVRLAVSTDQIEAHLARIQNAFWLTLFTVAAAAVMIAALIAQATTQPLRQLTQAVESLSGGEPSADLVPSTRDEVAQLTLAFNAMSNRLQEQIFALKSESAKLSAVLHEMTDGVMVVDDNGQILLLNPAAARIFNLPAGQTTARSLTEVVRHYQIIEIWQRCRQSGQQQSILLDLFPQKLSLQATAVLLSSDPAGNCLLLYQDMTRLRQLETIRRDFISNVSHELRTPLASLKAITETLQDSALDDPPAARRFLQQMETEVDALSLMVSELLELARIESGKVPLHFEAAAPSAILERAADRLRLQAERAGLQIHIRLPDLLPQVLADRSRIEQVVVNLLHNAIKFTPAGGQITLSARCNHSDEEVEQQVVFSVQDTGVGIPAQNLPRIFERFYKADRARSGGGTGLGLAISRHLVEAHGGQIWANSQENQGSTFFFSLPVYTDFV